MTRTQLFERLLDLAATPAGRSGTLLESDLLDQTALFAAQERLATLLADVATAIGPTAARKLTVRFPRSFSTPAVTR